ncbi:MAG: LptF/LptG family permease [Endomicrobiia bacterium]
MKVLNKYILKDFSENFLIYSGIISLLFLLNSIYQLIKPLLSNQTSFVTIIKLFLFLFPSVISLSIPITILLVTLLTFSSMKEFGEITIINTLGLKRFDYTKIIIFLSLIISVFLVYFNGYIAPISQKKFKLLYKNFLLSSPMVKFIPKTFINFSNKKIYVNNIKDGILKNVYIYNPTSNSSTQIISAKSATIEVNIEDDIILNLNNGRLSVIDKQTPHNTIQMLFNKYIFVIYSAQIKNVVDEIITLRELTNSELLNFYKTSNTTIAPTKVILSEYFLRYTLSFSTFFFVLIGTILGLQFKQNSKPLSFVFTIIIVGIYYFILSACLTIAQRTTKNNVFFITMFLMQIPNVFLLTIYLLFTKKFYKN